MRTVNLINLAGQRLRDAIAGAKRAGLTVEISLHGVSPAIELTDLVIRIRADESSESLETAQR